MTPPDRIAELLDATREAFNTGALIRLKLGGGLDSLWAAARLAYHIYIWRAGQKQREPAPCLIVSTCEVDPDWAGQRQAIGRSAALGPAAGEVCIG